MKILVIGVVVSMIFGLISGWYIHQYYVGIKMLNCAVIESTMWLDESQKILRLLSAGNVDSAQEQLITSMEKSIDVFDSYKSRYCIREGAEDCEIIYNKINQAREYLHGLE